MRQRAVGDEAVKVSQERRTLLDADLQLTAIGILPFVGHAHRPSSIMLVRPLKLILKVLSPDALTAAPGPGWVSTLDHEPLDVPMEDDVSIIPLLGQLNEIPDRLWRPVCVQFDIQITHRRRYLHVALVLDAAPLQQVLLVG